MSSRDREELVAVLKTEVSRLEEFMSADLVPEVGTNIAYALPNARTPDDVAAVEGRVVRLAGKAHAVGDVRFGASDHVARIVLTAMKFDPVVRAAANIRYSPENVSLLEDMLLEVCSFDRTKEPPGIRTMDWGVASCCRTGVPDVIYDRGGMGKEPMIRILGEDPGVIVNNIIKLSARIIIE